MTDITHALAHGPRLLLAVLFGLGATSCGPTDARFTTRFASGFVAAHRSVSILGVYKDGQMDSDAWETLAPLVSPSLGAGLCEAAYAEPLVSANVALSSAIDDYARSSGPTDDLLAQLAPAAKGDLVVVFTLAGTLTPSKPKGPTPTGFSGAPQGGSPRAGMHRGTRRLAPTPGIDPNELDVSATIFSVAEKRSVGLVSMQYVGASVDEAIRDLSAEVARQLPGARCAGWDLSVAIDPDRIRRSIDE